MTKTERLLFLINLFRVRRSLSLGELSSECDVSRRTIYRDMVSLSAMNINLNYDGKYRLANDITLPPLSFTRDEQEIIGYCLADSALIKSPKMQKQIKSIELKLLSMLKGRARNDLNIHLQGSTRPVEQFTGKEDAILSQFLNAVFRKQSVDVRLNNGIGNLNDVIPKTLEIKGKIWWLNFLKKTTSKQKRVRLEKIISIVPRVGQ